MFFKRERKHSAFYEGVLGTSCRIEVTARSQEIAEAAEALALAEIDRLEVVFNAYSPDSEFSRWQHDGEGEVSLELGAVLAEAERWRVKTGGSFNPAVEGLTRLWVTSAKDGAMPPSGAIESLVFAIQGPLWSVEGGRATARVRIPATLNSLAKGYIVDKAVERASGLTGVTQVLMDIGGDVRHRGNVPVKAGISDPFRPMENAEPVDVVKVQNQGLATSGNYRRGFQIGERWFSHVLDPRTGRPVDHSVSVSVLAPDTATADVLATACSVLEPQASLSLVDSLEGIGILIINADGSRLANDVWRGSSVARVAAG